MTRETEIKISLEDAGVALPAIRERIESKGFQIHKPRVFERNLVFDRPDGSLQSARQLLRLRDAGGEGKLTFKGVPEPGRHKSREERETVVENFGEMRVILQRLGYAVAFVYEKYRTEYAHPGTDGTITVDETPIGYFLELEGPGDWIDQTAALLGFGESDYQTGSYGTLYREWCQKNGFTPTNMVFSESPTAPASP